MLDFWFPVNELQEPDKQNNKTNNKCIKIHLPDKCPHCNQKFGLGRDGDTTYSSMFDSNYTCDHVSIWKLVWDMRIIISDVSNLFVIKRNIPSDPTKDGCKCSGPCGNWVPMAAPNNDGIFVCYGCRTEF